MKFNRRAFTKSILGIGGTGVAGAILYPLLSESNPLEIGEPEVGSMVAGNITDFEVNSARIIQFNNKPVLLIRKKNGDFAALSAICSHQDNLVQYREDTQQVICASHHEVYDLNGRSVSGTSKKHLNKHKVQVENEQVIITT